MTSSYTALLSLLEGSRSQLRPVPAPARLEETLAWLRQRRFAEVKAADAACEVFAEGAQWPELRVDSVVAQVHLRLTNAISLCRALAAQIPPAGATRQHLLRMLLIDYWHGKVSRLLGSERGIAIPGPVLPSR